MLPQHIDLDIKAIIYFEWNILDDKGFTRQKREEAITQNQERAELSAKEKAEKKRENEKYAMNEMMKVMIIGK